MLMHKPGTSIPLWVKGEGKPQWPQWILLLDTTLAVQSVFPKKEPEGFTIDLLRNFEICMAPIREPRNGAWGALGASKNEAEEK